MQAYKSSQAISIMLWVLPLIPRIPTHSQSACLDRTVKIWSLGSSTPNFTLEAHETKGVNFIDYYPQSDKPYLLTTSDDRTVKVWDYTTKALIATLEGHTSNVSFAVYHPELPVIVSGSEDGTIKDLAFFDLPVRAVIELWPRTCLVCIVSKRKKRRSPGF